MLGFSSCEKSIFGQGEDVCYYRIASKTYTPIPREITEPRYVITYSDWHLIDENYDNVVLDMELGEEALDIAAGYNVVDYSFQKKCD